MINARNITLTKWSLYFETKNPNVLFPIVGKYLEERLVTEFGALFSKQDIDKLNDKNTFLLRLYNRAYNIYPALHEAIRNGLQCELKGKIKESLINSLEYFEQYFGRKFERLEDLDAIKQEAERLQRKYRSMKPQEVEQEDKPFDMETMIISVELTLEHHINRGLKLFQFVPYYKRAVKKSKK